MIKVLEQKDEPRATAICDNCHSVLEYGNCDIRAHTTTPPWSSSLKEIVDYYYIYCPVCNCQVKVSKITT